jgi:hypothetical protein
VATKYILGLDLGQKRDPAAVAVVRWERAGAVHAHTSLTYPGARAEAIYTVVHIERVPLGTPYESIVQTVCALRQNPLFRPTLGAPLPPLVEDCGGVGSAVSEMFRRAGTIPHDILTVPGVGYTRDPETGRTTSRRSAWSMCSGCWRKRVPCASGWATA